jgi:serine/threonine-protein kinase
MSPEQVTGAPITFAADLYALGITLYEMLCGALPFRGPDFVAQHLADPVPPTGLGPAWDDLLRTLLAKSPAARPGSHEEVRAALAAIGHATSAPVRPSARVPTPTPVHALAPGERLQDLAPLGETAWSRLESATDAGLGRAVVVETMLAPLADLRRLQAVARAGGPFLQRVLRIDGAQGRVVYERIVGPPLGDRPIDAASAQRLALALAQALRALHAEGIAHGAISAETIVGGDGSSLLLVAGFFDPRPGAASEAARDVEQVIALIERVAGPWPAARGATSADELVRAALG